MKFVIGHLSFVIRHWQSAMAVLVLLFSSNACSGRGKHNDRHEIELSEGVKRTEAGEFILIVMADDLVSFQSGPTGKWQYYFESTNRAATLAAIQKAITVATNSGHPLHFENFDAVSEITQ